MKTEILTINKSIKTLPEKFNYKRTITLIGTHIIVTDNVIDNKELQVIYNYNNGWREIEKEINDIYSGSLNKISLNTLISELKGAPKEIIRDAYQLFLEIIYSDGYYDKEEKEIMKVIRDSVNINDVEFLQIENRVSNNIKLYNEKEEKWSDNLKIGFYGLMDNLSPNADNIFKKKKKEILLNGFKFVEKIKEISEYAKHDLSLSEDIITKSSNRISILLDSLSKHTNNLKTANRKDKELDVFTETLQKVVNENAIKQLSENIEVLNKKRKSVDYFTISFLGRTKAGKSTLHSIITKEGDEAIGVGKVRTTRFNRIYNWENLRIIDTPGIGAPNGEIDVDIAESIVDESDLICYLVTNDAIQETEFKFLSEIKKKNKPVVILLNVKENIENETRKKIFLKNPLKWKNRTDNKSIQGHIDRVIEYMNKFYHNNYYKVIPVMLLSAKLSEVELDDEVSKVLYEASNIEEFLTTIKDSVFENGHLRKSQNIIDGSNVRLNNIHENFTEQFNIISSIIHKLEKERKSFSSFIVDNNSKYVRNLNGTIDSYIFNIKKFAKEFALNNYELSEKDVSKRWEIELKNRGYIKQLDEKIKYEFSNIQEEIKTWLKESLDSFQLYFNNISFDLKTESTFNSRRATEIVGGLIYVGGSVVLAFGLLSNPIGWAITIGGIIVGLGSLLFDSKDKKIKRAQAKIEESLINGIKELEQQYKKQSIKELNKMLSNYKESVNSNMLDLINNANLIKKQLNKELISSKLEIDLLNKAMMIRIFQHTKHIKFDKDINNSIDNDKSITKITRDFNKNKIKLTTTHKIKPETIKRISELIQSDFNITSN